MAKNTHLTVIHQKAGARMAEFAGFNMPIEYSGITDEHHTVRNSVGIFDVSHMGEIWVKGEKSLDFLQMVCSNDIAKLSPGKAQYNYFPNGKGGIVDDLIVYHYSANKYMLVVNASNTEKDYKWLVKNKIEGVEIENNSDAISQIAVQGPRAIDVLKKITSCDLSSMKPFTFIEGTLADAPNVIIATTGYTGEKGFELYFYNQYAENVWNALLKAGEEFGIKPIGLGARDTLRLEMGYSLYGNDIDDSTSPIEAGLSWVTKPASKPNLIDRDTLIKQLTEGVSRCMVGFEMIDRGIPRHDYLIYDISGTQIGRVTSGSVLPGTSQGIGMGYVAFTHTEIDSDIYIEIRNKRLKAKVVKMPFKK